MTMKEPSKGRRRRVSDIAFTPAVKTKQEALGSRAGYERAMGRRDWSDRVTPELAQFLAGRDSFYLASVNSEGQPYIQHRGGPKGFLRVVDERHLAFADYAGNRQYITLGNLEDNPKVALFLMDYANRQRIKIWGEAEAVDEAELIARLMPEGYAARPERAIRIRVRAWDVNCPQHITRRFDEKDVAGAIAHLEARIAELEEENAELRSFVKAAGES